ncbi:MAG TPA: hypothetical protein VIA06_21080 [Candidatus Dormibacteraeota bacterium]|jgi:tetratricopeptide (TPR) repeat protein|nr:hypothetical protein [Candidatus Dormibacteraeota bacterium]
MRPSPPDPDTHLRLAEREYRAGRLEAAALAYQRAFDLQDPGSKGAAAFGLGLMRLLQGDRRRALLAWRQAMATHDPEFAPRAACFIAVWLVRTI